MVMRIVYDPVLRQPGCAILQAMLGGDRGMANHFPSESWLLAPTPDMRCYEVTAEQLNHLVIIADGVPPFPGPAAPG